MPHGHLNERTTVSARSVCFACAHPGFLLLLPSLLSRPPPPFSLPPPLPCPAPLPPQLGAVTAREKRDPKGVAVIPLCATKSRVIPLCTVWLHCQRGGHTKDFLLCMIIPAGPTRSRAIPLCRASFPASRSARGLAPQSQGRGARQCDAAAPDTMPKMILRGLRQFCRNRAGCWPATWLALHARARANAFCCRDVRCCQRMNTLTLHGGLAVPNHHATLVGSGAWDLVAADSVATSYLSAAS